jgi:hypothetical protein
MLFSEAVELIYDSGNHAIVLNAQRSPASVLLAPELVGRVMCSTFDRNGGLANAWINKTAIQLGKVDPVFNNFGGEERFWLAPEGGPFGLEFGKKESKFENYCVQPGMSTIAYKVSAQDDKSAVMEADLCLENHNGTQFELRVQRRISLVESCPYTQAAGGIIELAGFQSENTVLNIGTKAWTKAGGTISMWCLGQLLEHPHLSIIVPVRPGWGAESSPPTVDEYFKDFCIDGKFPSNRRANFDSFVLLKADGAVRGKVGIKRERAAGRLGSYDPDANCLTIVDHDFYPELEYPTGFWKDYENAFDGDALSVYIDGPEYPGGRLGVSYELETLSPALFLRPQEEFSYRNRTFHLRGNPQDLEVISQRFLGPSLSQIAAFERASA